MFYILEDQIVKNVFSYDNFKVRPERTDVWQYDLYIVSYLLYNSSQHQTSILKEYMGDTEGEKGRRRLGHSTHFHTSGKSNHFWVTKWLIFFPVRSPRLALHISGSLARDWLCSEWEGHNWPWPQTVWGLSPALSAPVTKAKKRGTERKNEMKSTCKKRQRE